MARALLEVDKRNDVLGRSDRKKVEDEHARAPSDHKADDETASRFMKAVSISPGAIQPRLGLVFHE